MGQLHMQQLLYNPHRAGVVGQAHELQELPVVQVVVRHRAVARYMKSNVKANLETRKLVIFWFRC